MTTTEGWKQGPPNWFWGIPDGYHKGLIIRWDTNSRDRNMSPTVIPLKTVFVVKDGEYLVGIRGISKEKNYWFTTKSAALEFAHKYMEKYKFKRTYYG